MTSLPINLDELIHARTVESNRREFKKTWDEYILEATVRTVCAFANDLLNLNGGYVVLGIEEDANGNPALPPRGLGGFNLDRIQRELRGQCNRIDPDYQPVLSPEIYMGQPILVVWAPGGDNRPYQAPRSRHGGERAYYIRSGPETIEATGDLLRQLLERTARVPFDDRRNQQASVTGISPALVRRFLASVRSKLLADRPDMPDSEIYGLLRIVDRVNAHAVPRNVALLFFHENPASFFPGARMEIVQFADGAGGGLIEEKSVTGPLPEQIQTTLDYLNSFSDVLVKKVAGQAEVDRTVAYPYEAMEEAIVNAYYHRSYEGSFPEPNKVYLYPDRMEIISYPGPVQGITAAALQSGAIPPVPARNRRIGEFLKELRLAEGRGTGVPTIRRKMQENGSPEPVFDFDEGRTYFRVILPAHPRYRVVHAIREGARLWATGERQRAMELLNAAFQQQPGSGALAGQLIDYAFALDDLPLAEEILARFRNAPAKTEEGRPHLRYADGLLNKGRGEEARRVLLERPAVAREESYESAILHKRAGDFETAHRLFAGESAGRADDPKFLHEYAQTKIELAWRLRRSRRGADDVTRQRLLREARELLHRAIQLSPDQIRQAWCWFDLARVLDRLGEPMNVIEEAYQRALTLKPEEARFQSGYANWKAGVARRGRNA